MLKDLESISRIWWSALKRPMGLISDRLSGIIRGNGYIVFRCGDQQDRRIGIFVKGSCDLNSVFACQPLISPILNGTCCIFKEGIVANARSDYILQCLQGIPPALVQPVLERFHLTPDYFQTQFFHEDFAVEVKGRLECFPKVVVILSIMPDVSSALYRHKEHHYVIDPRGWWLTNSVEAVMNNLTGVSWFRKHFEYIGKIGVETFQTNFSTIIERIKKRTRAHIMIFNSLTVEPEDKTHNYQFIKKSDMIRHREFNLALVDLSRKLDFSIVDVDRILKRYGIKRQLDIRHFPQEYYKPIATEVVRIMRQVGIF
jgi:hypothetical protein